VTRCRLNLKPVKSLTKTGNISGFLRGWNRQNNLNTLSESHLRQPPALRCFGNKSIKPGCVCCESKIGYIGYGVDSQWLSRKLKKLQSGYIFQIPLETCPPACPSQRLGE
jgi:hypothetical protein